MDAPHAAPPAAASSRQLTTRELATIRAALRCWTVLAGEGGDNDPSEAGLAEVGGAAVLSDREIEQLLVELALAGDVVLTALDPEALDRRRI